MAINDEVNSNGSVSIDITKRITKKLGQDVVDSARKESKDIIERIKSTSVSMKVQEPNGENMGKQNEVPNLGPNQTQSTVTEETKPKQVPVKKNEKKNRFVTSMKMLTLGPASDKEFVKSSSYFGITKTDIVLADVLKTGSKILSSVDLGSDKLNYSAKVLDTVVGMATNPFLRKKETRKSVMKIAAIDLGSKVIGEVIVKGATKGCELLVAKKPEVFKPIDTKEVNTRTALKGISDATSTLLKIHLMDSKLVDNEYHDRQASAFHNMTSFRADTLSSMVTGGYIGRKLGVDLKEYRMSSSLKETKIEPKTIKTVETVKPKKNIPVIEVVSEEESE